MPWKETCVMEQRIKFVVRAASGQESISGLCREFGLWVSPDFVDTVIRLFVLFLKVNRA